MYFSSSSAASAATPWKLPLFWKSRVRLYGARMRTKPRAVMPSKSPGKWMPTQIESEQFGPHRARAQRQHRAHPGHRSPARDQHGGCNLLVGRGRAITACESAATLEGDYSSRTGKVTCNAPLTLRRGRPATPRHAASRRNLGSRGGSLGAAVNRWIGNDCYGSRPCENVRERINRRIVFSIAFFGQPLRDLLVLRLKKSKRTFYAQIERGSFRTASVDSRQTLRALNSSRPRAGRRSPLQDATRSSRLPRPRPVKQIRPAFLLRIVAVLDFQPSHPRPVRIVETLRHDPLQVVRTR